MRKELYRMLCRELKAIDLIKHIDLWNHNVEFIEQEENWERPAVFVEFCPIQWNAIVPGVEYRAEPLIKLHIVTDWEGSSAEGSELQEDALKVFEQRIRRRHDTCAYLVEICEHCLKHVRRAEADEIIHCEEYERHNHCDDALIFQLEADFGDQPAERAGQHHYEYRDHQQRDDRADDGGDCDRRYDPVDYHRRNEYDRRVHQAHEVHAHKTRTHDYLHGDRHRQQEVVILGDVQAGIGVENAAERAEEYGHQPHEREVQPVHADRSHCIAQCKRQKRENAAQHSHHYQHEKHYKQCSRERGALLILLRIVEVAPEYLHELLFYKRFQHDVSSSSRKTSSRLSSPLTSSMVPARMSLPDLIMATLSQSFSATSRTWVEKNIAPPLSQTSRIIPLSRCAAFGSRPTNGSSMIMSFGSCSHAEIIASFCFMPCEYAAMGCARSSVSSKMSAYLRMCS